MTFRGRESRRAILADDERRPAITIPTAPAAAAFSALISKRLPPFASAIPWNADWWARTPSTRTHSSSLS
jgi:hypothetical protein